MELNILSPEFSRRYEIIEANQNIMEMLTINMGSVPNYQSGEHGGITVCFDKAVCDNCKRQSDCPVKRNKQHGVIQYDDKSLRLSRRRAHERTAEFKERYRFRSGVEGTMSDLDRMTGLKHLRVRGMPQVRLAATLKATGLNILRTMTFKNRLKRQEKAQKGSSPSENRLFNAVKELFQRGHDNLQGSVFDVAINCLRMCRLIPQVG